MTFLAPKTLQALQEDQTGPIIYTPRNEDFGKKIEEFHVNKGEHLTLEEWDPKLRVGREVYLSTEGKIQQLKEGEDFSIKPGEFALILTRERLKLPAGIGAMINLRLTYKARGLVNISGFHVDPNYHGHAMFSVYNAGTQPILLREGDEVFMVIFVEMTAHVDDERDGKFNTGISRIDSSIAGHLQNPGPSLAQLNHQVHLMRVRVNVLYTILGGIIVAAVGGLVATLI